jgi:Predicted amidophosphoribosyltransferases
MRILENVLKLLYPNRCVFCEELGELAVCEKCKKEVIYVMEPRCKKCGKPIRYSTQEYCYDCENKEKAFDEGRSLWLHKGVVAQSLYRFKYCKRIGNGKFYAQELVKQYAQQMKRWEIMEIIPVPVHKKRLAKRGFNQSEVVAKYMSEYLQIPMNATAVERSMHTKPQKQVGGKRRRQNLKGAFRMNKGAKVAKNILLIDDIYTTGSTLEELARTLRRAGARKVCFLTISIGQGM